MGRDDREALCLKTCFEGFAIYVQHLLCSFVHHLM